MRVAVAEVLSSLVSAANQAESGGDSGGAVLEVVIGAGAVLLGAVVAAGTAIWNVKRQLAHDRDLREVEGLRVIFDESLSAIDSLQDYLTRSSATDPIDAQTVEYVGRISLSAARLQMRLGADHTVTSRWQGLTETLIGYQSRDQNEAAQTYLAARREYINAARKHLAVRLSEAG